MLKNFKVEIENQLNKRIKSVRSNHSSEYYGRCDGLGEQSSGPFAEFLEKCNIIPQYTTSGSPTMNSVAERQNMMLEGLVRSNICHSILPESFYEKHLRLHYISSTKFQLKQLSKPITNFGRAKILV